MTETEKKRRIGGREATAAIIPGDYAISVGNPQSSLPEGWRWRLLTDLARLESGHTPSRKRNEYWGGDVPWVGIRDATANHGRTIYATNENTNELGIANSAARILPAETVCLSRTASVGYVVVMGRPMATSQDFVNWTCGPELDYRYLKYALIAEGAALLRFADGSVHQTIYFPEVKALHIALPDRREQAAIADVLSALDEKIELNRRMIETLEAMAQAIFKDWFVEFGPVKRKMAATNGGHDCDPAVVLGGLIPDSAKATPIAALFPDSLSEIGLPDKWLELPLEKTLILQRGFDLPKTARSDGRFPVIAASGPSGTHDRFKVRGPGVCTGRSGVLGGVFFVREDFWPLNTSLWIKDYPNATPLYAYYLLRTLDLLALNAGSAVPTLNRNHVHQLFVPTPPMAVVLEFEKLASALYDRIGAAEAENRSLCQTRDYLLPRLISGAVRVRDVEKAVEDERR